MEITYEDKENLNLDSSIPNKNKITADDMNQIKQVVNTNATSTLFFEVAEDDD